MNRFNYQDEFKELEDYFVKKAILNQKGDGFSVFQEYNPQTGGFLPFAPTLSLIQYLSRRGQKGDGFGSFLKGLFRAAIPLFKSGAKAVGKQAVHTGIDIVRDVAQGHNWKEASQKRLNEAGDAIVEKTKQKVEKIMTGSGRITKRKMNKKEAFTKKLFSLIGPPEGTHQFKKGKIIKKWI